MKYLIPLLFLFTSCAHIPMLEPGSCYRAEIGDLLLGHGNYQFLASFKVGNISTFKDKEIYYIEPLDLFGDPVYPGFRSYGYVEVDFFDRYISPTVYKFNFDNPEAHQVKCNSIKEEPPLSVQGRKP